MQLFYNPNIETNLFLENEEHTHASKVLRKKNGDLIHVINGKGDLFSCEINQISNKKTFVTILDKKTFPKQSNLHIGIAPTKNNNRMEFFLEKATEIGISKITPILCERSERKMIKNERMEKIILSATKQSQHFHLPILSNMISFEKLVTQTCNETKLIAHCEDEASKTNFNSLELQKKSPVLILIGPEGDFTEKEIQLALKNNYQEVSLGDSRLRTETAGMVATTLYNSL